MKITKTSAYTVVFYVGYFEGTEGGMDSETFGPNTETLEEAIELLDLARVSKPSYDWIIVAEVQKLIKGS